MFIVLVLFVCFVLKMRLVGIVVLAFYLICLSSSSFFPIIFCFLNVCWSCSFSLFLMVRLVGIVLHAFVSHLFIFLFLSNYVLFLNVCSVGLAHFFSFLMIMLVWVVLLTLLSHLFNSFLLLSNYVLFLKCLYWSCSFSLL